MQDVRNTAAGTDNSGPVGPWGDRGHRIISFVSQKGGVAKTTSAVNLAACFALSGHRVLLIGADPQCGVAASFGVAPDQLRGGLREVILSGMPLVELAHETELANLRFVVPDVWTLQEEEQYKNLMRHQAGSFGDAVRDALDDFDTILIDCPPGFGPETRAALQVSDGYLVPVQAEELCRTSLDRLLRFVDDFQTINPSDLELDGLFLTMTDHRTRLSRSIAAQLDERFGPTLLDSSVPRTTRLAEMAVQGRPTVIFDRRSTGSRAYFDLMDEIVLKRLHAAPGATAGAERPASRTAAPVAAPPRELSAAAGRGAPPRAAAETSAAGLMRLLGELGGGATAYAPLPAYEEEEEEEDPDMLSLEDLLAEEETDDETDDEAGWGYGEDSFGTIN